MDESSHVDENNDVKLSMLGTTTKPRRSSERRAKHDLKEEEEEEEEEEPVVDVDEKKKGRGGPGSSCRQVTLKDLQALFHLPITQASHELSICTTVLKKICRKYNIKRWPYRQIRSVTKSMELLEAAAGNHVEEGSEVAQQLEALRATRKALIENPGAAERFKDIGFSVNKAFHHHAKTKVQAFLNAGPSEDESTTSPASASSPEGHSQEFVYQVKKRAKQRSGRRTDSFDAEQAEDEEWGTTRKKRSTAGQKKRAVVAEKRSGRKRKANTADPSALVAPNSTKQGKKRKKASAPPPLPPPMVDIPTTEAPTAVVGEVDDFLDPGVFEFMSEDLASNGLSPRFFHQPPFSSPDASAALGTPLSRLAASPTFAKLMEESSLATNRHPPQQYHSHGMPPQQSMESGSPFGGGNLHRAQMMAWPGLPMLSPTHQFLGVSPMHQFPFSPRYSMPPLQHQQQRPQMNNNTVKDDTNDLTTADDSQPSPSSLQQQQQQQQQQFQHPSNFNPAMYRSFKTGGPVNYQNLKHMSGREMWTLQPAGLNHYEMNGVSPRANFVDPSTSSQQQQQARPTSNSNTPRNRAFPPQAGLADQHQQQQPQHHQQQPQHQQQQFGMMFPPGSFMPFGMDMTSPSHLMAARYAYESPVSGTPFPDFK